MILTDWITAVIFLPHKRLKPGYFASVDIDKNGKPYVSSVREKRIICEGSYSSSISIRTCPGIESIESEFEDKIADSNIPLGHSAFIEVSGNPIKFLQGHNIFGCSDIYFLTYQAVKKCFQVLGLDYLISDLKTSVFSGDWRVTRIDITKMLQLDTNEQVDDYIFHTSRTSHIRSGNVEFTKNTLYFGKNSTVWSIKIYNKFKELSSRSKKHQLPLPLKFSGLKEWVEGQLRVELTLRKKELDKLEMINPDKLQKNINKLFNDYLGKIEMKPQKEIENLFILPKALQGTYLLWKQGNRLKELLSKPTFYRHRKELLNYGVDISVAPLLDEQRHTDIKTIKQVLEPREVRLHHIPKQLRQYLAMPESSLRVA